jgi:hypothetical protein
MVKNYTKLHPQVAFNTFQLMKAMQNNGLYCFPNFCAITIFKKYFCIYR